MARRVWEMEELRAGGTTVPDTQNCERLAILAGGTFDGFDNLGVVGSMAFSELALEFSLLLGPLLSLEDGNVWI